MKTDPRKKKERKKNIKEKRENKYTELSFQWGEGRHPHVSDPNRSVPSSPNHD